MKQEIAPRFRLTSTQALTCLAWQAGLALGLALLALAAMPLSPAYADDPSFDESHPFGGGFDSTNSVAVGDVNGDGRLDIVAGNGHSQGGSGGPSVVYLNDGESNFYTGPVDCTMPPANAHCFGSSSDDTHSVALGDLDGDGALDIVAGNSGQNVVYLNDGTGNFPITHTFGGGSIVTLGDMNGDGALDIVTGGTLLE